jgi:hypothetical protein
MIGSDIMFGYLVTAFFTIISIIILAGLLFLFFKIIRGEIKKKPRKTNPQ